MSFLSPDPIIIPTIILKSADAGAKTAHSSETTLYFESPVLTLTDLGEPSRTGPGELTRVVPGLRPLESQILGDSKYLHHF